MFDASTIVTLLLLALGAGGCATFELTVTGEGSGRVLETTSALSLIQDPRIDCTFLNSARSGECSATISDEMIYLWAFPLPPFVGVDLTGCDALAPVIGGGKLCTIMESSADENGEITIHVLFVG